MIVTVSIVEDNAGLRETLVRILNQAQGFRCLHSFPSAEEALQGIPAAPPNVILMDINLPGMSGVECVQRLRRSTPQAQVIMLTVYDDTEKIYAALKAGAIGYILKRASMPQLLEAIQEAVDGGAPMSTAIARKVVQSFQEPRPPDEMKALSTREQQVLEMLAKGYLYKEISDEMRLTLGTVRTYIRRIYTKLHVRSRTQAVAKYLRQGGS